MRRYFVTGTDTEIGKTTATACIAAALRLDPSQPRTVRALKPVASGVTPEDPHSDAARIARAAGHAPACWLALPDPISPHRAQERAGVQADPQAMTAWISTFTDQIVLVEGAGGWLVPLLRGPDGALFEVPDLAHACGGPVILVAADRLGVLNHTRLTAWAIAESGLDLAGVVLNQGGPGDPSRSTNLDDLRALLPCPVAVLPPLPDERSATLAAAGAPIVRALGL